MINIKIKQKLEEFENKRISLLDEMETLDEATLQARPVDGMWSVLEIIEHLVIAEREVMGDLPKYENIVAQTQSFLNGIMYQFVMTVLRFGIPVKAPSKRMLPKSELSLADFRKQWDENQKWFIEYVEGLNDEGLKKAVFTHPVSGPINTEQAIDMSLAHLNSHTSQIRKRLDLLI